MSATTTTIPRRAVTSALHIPRKGALYALFVLGALVYWPASVALFDCWVEPSDRNYRHGFLILAACAWLVYRASDAFAAVETRPSRLALALLIAATLAWVVFWKAAIQDLFLLGVPVILWLAVAAAWGWKAAGVMSFPIGFIVFAEPAWGSLAVPLQHMTAAAVTTILHGVGLPITRTGTLLAIPEGTFHVDLGCAGVHYMTVGLALAALAGELEQATYRRRAYLLVLMATLAILCNWIRVGAIIVAGHLTHMQHWLITRDHYWFGWGLFLILVMGFAWFVMRPEPVQTSAQPERGGLRMRPALVAAVLGLVSMPAFAYVSAAVNARGSAQADRDFPPRSDSWSGPYPVTNATWSPHFAGADAERKVAYVDRAGHAIELFHVSYRQQRQGAELVNYANSLTGDRLETQNESRLSTPAGALVETEVIDALGRKSVIWSRYEIGGQRFASSFHAQLWYGLMSVVGSPSSSLWAARAECGATCESARAALSSFLSDVNAVEGKQ